MAGSRTLTRKAALTVAFAIWIFVLGLTLRSDLLLLSAVPVVAYFILLQITEANIHLKVQVDRSSSHDAVYEGDTVRFTLRVQNVGPSLPVLEVFDEIPTGLETTEGSNHVVTSLERGEARSFTYSVAATSFGSYTLGPIKVRAMDLGRNHSEETTVTSSMATLWVYPEVRYLNRTAIRPRRPRNWPGETATRRAGTGVDFYGVRDYVPGDPLRRVNWKATSRTDRTMLVNQFVDEAGGDIMIVVDARLASQVGPPQGTTLIFATRAAATLAYRLLRDRNRVGLMGIGDNLVKVLPGFGRRQFEKVLAGLLVLTPGDGWEIENLSRLLAVYFSKQTQTVVISPLLDDKSYRAIVQTSNAGYSVVAISPSPIELEVGALRRQQTKELNVAVELARLRRETRLIAARRYAAVVDWDVTKPLGDVMQVLQVIRQASS